MSKRSRMVSFRVSPEEYDSLREASVTEGARSVSDFARFALCRLARTDAPPNGNGSLQAGLDQLNDNLKQLNRELGLLNQTMERRPSRPMAAIGKGGR
jgi:uncharacterized protein (DUF1778 family)